MLANLIGAHPGPRRFSTSAPARAGPPCCSRAAGAQSRASTRPRRCWPSPASAPPRSWPRSRSQVGDAHALDFPDRSFDVVVSLRVLMHTPNWRRCLAELCRVGRSPGDRRLSVGAERRAVQSMARRLAHALRRARRSRTACFPTATIAAAFEQQRLPHPLRPSAVRPADRVPQGHRIAARFTTRSENAARPARPARRSSDHR